MPRTTPRIIDCTRCEGAGFELEHPIHCFINDCELSTICSDCTEDCKTKHTTECRQCDGTGEEYEEAPNRFDDPERF